MRGGRRTPADTHTIKSKIEIPRLIFKKLARRSSVINGVTVAKTSPTTPPAASVTAAAVAGAMLGFNAEKKAVGRSNDNTLVKRKSDRFPYGGWFYRPDREKSCIELSWVWMKILMPDARTSS